MNAVHDSFYAQIGAEKSGAHIDQAIAHILDPNFPVADRSDRLLGPDDKGIVDVTSLAFRLLGYKVENVLYMYYLILGISSFLFVVCNPKSPFALLWLPGFFLIAARCWR